MRYLSIALVLILVLAVGCAKTIDGKKFDGTKTKDLLASGTNESKVVQMFGEPQQKEQLPSGETKYIYYYREDGKDQQRLEVFLKDNMTQRYRYVYQETETITKDIAPIEPEKK